MTSRFWCFTSYSENLNVLEDNVNFKYCCAGHETCPKTKELHWQGYIEFKEPVRFTGAQQIIGDTSAHMERKKGTREQARDYCFKEKGALVIEWGDFKTSTQGKRNDLEEMKDDIKSGASIDEVFDNHPTAWRYHKVVHMYKNMKDNLNERPFAPKEVIIIEGPTACGKSRYVHENYPGAYYKHSGKWWDGYIGQKTIVFEEFNPDDWKIPELNQICDGYDIVREIKGGTVTLKADNIIFCTNFKSDGWYASTDRTLRATLFRRVTLKLKYWTGARLEVREAGVPVPEVVGNTTGLASTTTQSDEYKVCLNEVRKLLGNGKVEKLESKDITEKLLNAWGLTG